MKIALCMAAILLGFGFLATNSVMFLFQATHNEEKALLLSLGALTLGFIGLAVLIKEVERNQGGRK